MHKDAYEASQTRENSYFDREEEKKVTMLKNEVYFKVFKALYWLAKEEIVSTKTTSLLELIETRNATCCRNRNDLIDLSFTLKISIFSEAYI